MSMHNPTHSRTMFNVSITATAESLGGSRKTLSTILNKRGAITAEMAMRLGLVFGKPQAEHRLKLQAAYDPYQARTCKTELDSEVHALAA